MDRFQIIKDVPQDQAKRKWYYVQKPQEYDITCDRCGGRNLDWSEYASKIWCYDCEIDTKGTGGVFDGPIPIGVAAVLGMSFDRYDMENKCILTYDQEQQKYVPKVKKKSDG